MKRRFQLTLAFIALLSLVAPLDSFARGGGSLSGGGGRSFSAPSSSSLGSRSFSSPSSSSSSGRIFSAPSTSERVRNFSTPSASSVPGSSGSGGSRVYSAPASDSSRLNSGSKPSAGSSGVDSGAQKARASEQSKQDFQSANAPKSAPAYRGNSDYQSQREQALRESNANLRGENRALREERSFGRYYNQPVVYYHDNFNIWFWLWLMDRPSQDRATWAYNHRDEMDSARYEELKRHDADFDKRLAALEAGGAKKDPTYVPQGVDRDLMYSQEYADGVNKPEGHGFLFYLFWVVVPVGALFGLWWLIFVKRWS